MAHDIIMVLKRSFIEGFRQQNFARSEVDRQMNKREVNGLKSLDATYLLTWPVLTSTYEVDRKFRHTIDKSTTRISYYDIFKVFAVFLQTRVDYSQ